MGFVRIDNVQITCEYALICDMLALVRVGATSGRPLLQDSIVRKYGANLHVTKTPEMPLFGISGVAYFRGCTDFAPRVGARGLPRA